MLIKFFYVCLSCFVGKLNAFDASFIQPCKPNDDECMLKSGQEATKHIVGGIPELGIPSFDPMRIDSIRSDSPNLKFGFRNVQIRGVSKCEITELRRNLEKNTIKLTAECPLIGTGQYDLSGKLLFLEVIGDGDYEIRCNKFKFTVDVKIKDIVENGRKYWKVTGFDFNYEILDKVHFKFDNLFGGDEERAKPLLEALDNSWKEISYEVSRPMVQKVLTINVENIGKLFGAIPTDQLEIV